MFFVFATIGMVPRLKLAHQWDSELQRGFFSLLSRLIPYLVCFSVSMIAGMGIMAVLGDLSLPGNYLMTIVAILLIAISVGLMSILVGWGAANPGVAISRMILFIPGGFILGGASGPLNIIPPAVQFISNIFPLVWAYRLFRDVAQRGAPLIDCLPVYGSHILYIAVLTLLLYWRFRRSHTNQNKEESA